MKKQIAMPGTMPRDSTFYANAPGKRELTSQTFNNSAAVQLTPEELRAVTRGDTIYEALAEIKIRRGEWVVVPKEVAV